MTHIIKFFVLLQCQAIGAIPVAHWLHGQCTPMTTLLGLLAWLFLGFVTLGFLHTAIIREMHRRRSSSGN